MNLSGHGQMWGYWNLDHMIFDPLVTGLFWGAIIILIVLFVRWITKTSTTKASLAKDNHTLETLKERFARGDLDKDEFEKSKKELLD
jgi:putative membrane protein